MRQHPRVTFRSIFRVKVSSRESDQLLGYVGDLSATGLRLLSDSPQPVGTCLDLRLRMRDREGELCKIDIRADCLWCRENIKTGYFESGLRLAGESREFSQWVASMRGRR